MSKTYNTPTVSSLGAAEVVTRGLVKGPIGENGAGKSTLTTHHMLDL